MSLDTDSKTMYSSIRIATKSAEVNLILPYEPHYIVGTPPINTNKPVAFIDLSTALYRRQPTY